MISIGPTEVDLLLSIVREAGSATMDVYSTEFTATMKEDRTPVTEADRRSHDIVLEKLTRYFPDIPVLSEEGTDVPYDVRSSWEQFWLVDPLDGTKEFIGKNGEFTVNVALIERTHPRIGFVYAPATRLLYYCDDNRSYRLRGESAKEVIQAREFDPDDIIVSCSRSHSSGKEQSVLSKLGATRAVPAGSSLKFCLVADGSADIYPRMGNTMEWDTGAGHAVLSKVGGSVRTQKGCELAYNKPVLRNPPFFACSGHEVARYYASRVES